jgi:hypothetical protein
VRACRIILFTSLSCWMLSGCVNSPRNGTKVVSRSSPVSVKGVVSVPNAFIGFNVMNTKTKRWESLSQGTTSVQDATTDAIGAKWYSYSGSLRLGGLPEYWKSAPTKNGQRQVTTAIALYNDSNGYLSSFEQDADACGQQYSNQGLFAVIDACHASGTPAINLFNDCGKSGQDCCIAGDIATADRCDKNVLCDSSYRCSIPAGGVGQACNVDGSCNSGSACISGTCRDTTVEKLPLLSLDLRVTTCNDSKWNISTGGSSLWVNLGKNDFYIEVPGKELSNDTTDTFGLNPSGIKRLKDITKLDIHIYNRDWCVSKVELITNDNVVFSKSYSSPLYLKATNPYSQAVLSIPRDELRTYWTTHSRTQLCAGPAKMSGGAISRKIVGALGNSLVTSDEIIGDFDQGGSVAVTKVNSSTVKATAVFEATKFVSGIGDINATLSTNFTVGFACSNGAISVKMSSVNVTDVDGGLATDILKLFTLGISNVAFSAIAESFIDKEQASLASSLDTVIDGLPACPTLSFDTAAPPNLNIGYPAGLKPTDLNICQ